MPRSATGHRHRRWSLRHPGQPHQPPRSWPYDQSCTNIQPGPPSGGRPIIARKLMLGQLIARADLIFQFDDGEEPSIPTDYDRVDVPKEFWHPSDINWD